VQHGGIETLQNKQRQKRSKKGKRSEKESIEGKDEIIVERLSPGK